MPSKLYKGIMPERGIISSRNSLHKGSEFLALSNKMYVKSNWEEKQGVVCVCDLRRKVIK